MVQKKSDEKAWITYMNRQVHKRNNCINAVFTGVPGSGKSWAMLSMAEALDPNFTLEGNWFFKAGPMMRAIKEYYFGENADPRPGKIWCLDEGGIDLNNMSFHDAINRGLNAFFQTARHRNYIFLMSVPYLKFISKGVRTLMTTHCRAEGWTKDSMTVIVPRVMEYNGDLDKFYRKRLVVIDENHNMQMCNKTHLPRPSDRLVKEYEQMKKEFTGDLFSDISASIDAYEAGEKTKSDKAAGKITLTGNQEDVLAALKQGLNAQQVADKLNTHRRSVNAAMVSMRNKGFKFRKVMEPGSSRVIKYEITGERERA